MVRGDDALADACEIDDRDALSVSSFFTSEGREGFGSAYITISKTSFFPSFFARAGRRREGGGIIGGKTTDLQHNVTLK